MIDIFDFVPDTVFNALVEWFLNQTVNVLTYLFGSLNLGGVTIFDLPAAQVITGLFAKFGWALFAVGFILVALDVAASAQRGSADFYGAALAIIKAFVACSLFTTLPVPLYTFCVSEQFTLMQGISQLWSAGYSGDMSSVSLRLIDGLQVQFKDSGKLLLVVLLIMVGYCTLKVFFANLKRGAILLIQIAVGSLYMVSLPRGYYDGFYGWCKQVIGLCLTAFLQTTLLYCGILTATSYSTLFLGIGIMLAANEIPRIAGQFGIDTSMRAPHFATALNTVGMLARFAA